MIVKMFFLRYVLQARLLIRLLMIIVLTLTLNCRKMARLHVIVLMVRRTLLKKCYVLRFKARLVVPRLRLKRTLVSAVSCRTVAPLHAIMARRPTPVRWYRSWRGVRKLLRAPRVCSWVTLKQRTRTLVNVTLTRPLKCIIVCMVRRRRSA